MDNLQEENRERYSIKPRVVMTLKEKFKEIFKNAKIHFINLDAQECVTIADDYAIEFGNWFSMNYLKYHDYGMKYTTQELLEIFKKEKGL
jgi:hypothetical protein